MKKEAVTYICFVQDHSGSMEPKNELAKSNFNEQINKILKEDDDNIDNLVSIVEFDDEINCLIENMPVNEVEQFKHWWTGGMTALYDAIAYGINIIKTNMDKDERDNKAALIVIQTDGYENASSDYSGEQGRSKLKKMIDDLENSGKWTFTFLGENIDQKIAVDIGFKSGNVMCFKGNHDDTRYAYNVQTDGLSNFLNDRKSGKTQTYSFYSKVDEDEQNKNSL